MLRAPAAVIVAMAVLPGAVCPQVAGSTTDLMEGPARPDSAGAAARGWLHLGIGGGWVRLEDTGSGQRGSFALDFGGGLWLRERVGLGARLGGWTLEAFDFWDPENGESLSEAFAVLRLRPLDGWPMVASLEGGWVSYTVNDPAATLRQGDGLGARVAVMWDARVWRRWVISPALVGSWGRIDPDSSLERAFGYVGIGALLEVGWRW